MLGKLKSLFKTIDITAPATGFEETRAIDAESSFQATLMEADTSFGDTQFVPGHTNRYLCACGEKWQIEATGVCNDTCPACGTDTAPRDD